MPIEVRMLVIDVVGQRTIASSPAVMNKIEEYTRNGRECGLSDAELEADISRFWPSVRRVIDVDTLPNGEVWVSMTLARLPCEDACRTLSPGPAEASSGQRGGLPRLRLDTPTTQTRLHPAPAQPFGGPRAASCVQTRPYVRSGRRP